MSAKTIKAIAFDFDGTLVDSNPVKREGFYVATREIEGASAALDHMYATKLPRNRWAIIDGVIEAVEDTGGQTAEQLVGKYAEYCSVRVEKLIEQSSIAPMFERLRGDGLAIYINTATPLEAITPILKKTGWFDRFDGVFGEPQSKQENLKSIMADLGLDKTEIALVGDGQPDIKAAKLVGCKFLKVDDGAGALFRMTARQAGDFLVERLGLST